MKKPRFEKPWVWYLSWSLFSLFMAVVALTDRAPLLREQAALLLQNVSAFTVLQWLAFIAPLVTALLIVLCHYADCRGNGPGIQARLRRIRGAKYTTDATFVSAAITKQSVIVAISIGTLLMVASLAGDAPAGFQKIASSVAIVGLACSIVLTLVSILCYDYSIRYKWHHHFREHLVRKGLKIEVLGWYVLTLSFVLAMSLLSIALSLAVNFLYGSLLLYYYFPAKFYDRKEDLWNRVDAFIRKNELRLETVSLHRVNESSADRDKNLWDLEVVSPSSPALTLFTIKEQFCDDDLRVGFESFSKASLSIDIKSQASEPVD